MGTPESRNLDAFVSMMRAKAAAHDARVRGDIRGEREHLADAAQLEPSALDAAIEARASMRNALDPRTVPEFREGTQDPPGGPPLPWRLMDTTHVNVPSVISTYYSLLGRGAWAEAYETMNELLTGLFGTSEVFNSSMPDVVRELSETLCLLQELRDNVPFEAVRCDICACLFPRPDLERFPQSAHTRTRCSAGCLRRSQRAVHDPVNE